MTAPQLASFVIQSSSNSLHWRGFPAEEQIAVASENVCVTLLNETDTSHPAAEMLVAAGLTAKRTGQNLALVKGDGSHCARLQYLWNLEERDDNHREPCITSCLLPILSEVNTGSSAFEQYMDALAAGYNR